MNNILSSSAINNDAVFKSLILDNKYVETLLDYCIKYVGNVRSYSYNITDDFNHKDLTITLNDGSVISIDIKRCSASNINSPNWTIKEGDCFIGDDSSYFAFIEEADAAHSGIDDQFTVYIISRTTVYNLVHSIAQKHSSFKLVNKNMVKNIVNKNMGNTSDGFKLVPFNIELAKHFLYI